MFMDKPLETIIYVTREIERALGVSPDSRYLIVTNRTPYGESVKKQYPDFVTLIENPTQELLGTTDLLNHLKTAEVFESVRARAAAPNSGLQAPDCLVFKNTARVETAVRDHHWKILNPSAALSEKVENKVTQVEWLGNSAEYYLPHHEIGPLKKLAYTGESFVLQWAHGHTGSGTILIDSQAELDALKAKFPYRMTRKSAFIQGPSFTVNALVAGPDVLVGNVSYQITGLAPFTDSRFATVGNDWGAAKAILSPAELTSIMTMTRDIGEKLRMSGWRGLYGVDIMRDDERGRIFLIEVNARQPASTPFESFLQLAERAKGVPGLTTFEAHLKALLRQPISEPLIPITDGAQIVQRVTNTVKSIPEDAVGSLELAGYQTVAYSNTKKDEDLLRIQSMNGIMSGHGTFNDKGKEIVGMIEDKQ